MTKKDNTIRNIIAGLTILILGALLVYSLIPSSSTNSPDKNQERSKKKQVDTQQDSISEHTANTDGEEAWKENMSAVLGSYTGRMCGFVLVLSIYLVIKFFTLDGKSAFETLGSLFTGFYSYWVLVGFIIAIGLGWCFDYNWRPVSYLYQWVSRAKIYQAVFGLAAAGTFIICLACIWIIYLLFQAFNSVGTPMVWGGGINYR